jgi:hypothetical protein
LSFWLLEPQRLSEPKCLDCVIRRDDLESDEPTLGLLDQNLARRKNRVTDTVERDLENIAANVEDKSENRQPTRLDMIAEIQRRDVELDAPAHDLSRNLIAIPTPFGSGKNACQHTHLPGGKIADVQ